MFARQISRATIRVTPRCAPCAPSWRLTAKPATRPFSTVNITFLNPDGSELKCVPAKLGQSLLEAAQDNGIDIEGACGGECACSTCHVIFDQANFDKLEEADEDELDMLDLAMHVTDTSRLGCQIKLVAERDEGLQVKLPEGTGNLLS